MIIAKKSCARSGDIQVEDGCLHRYARSDGRAVALMHRRKHHIAEGLFVGAGLPATSAALLIDPQGCIGTVGRARARSYGHTAASMHGWRHPVAERFFAGADA